MAAKQTSTLIPLCHPLPLTHVSVELESTPRGYRIEARVRTSAQTGVEMEALVAVAAAALTIYDMVKAIDKAMVIGDICLVEKRGGRSGIYRRRIVLVVRNVRGSIEALAEPRLTPGALNVDAQASP